MKTFSADNQPAKVRFKATGEEFYAVRWEGATTLQHGKHYCSPGDYVLAVSVEALELCLDQGYGRYVPAAHFAEEYEACP